MRFILPLVLSLAAQAQSFYAIGASMLPQSSPKTTGWAAVAVEASKTTQIWSISGMDFISVGKTIQTSAWTGIATPLRTFGTATLYALGAGGAATTGTNSGGAFTGGALLYIPIPNSAVAFVLGYAIEKTSISPSAQLIKLGIGWGSTK